MLLGLAQLFILYHLLVQLLLVGEEGVSAMSHELTLPIFHLLLPSDDLKVGEAILVRCSLQTSILISKLFLTI